MSKDHKIIIDYAYTGEMFRPLVHCFPPPSGPAPWAILMLLNSLIVLGLGVVSLLVGLGVIGRP